MIVQAEEMARAVRVAIDMNKGDEPLIMEGDTDTLTLDEIIMSKLADAVRMVVSEAPLHLLESGHDFGDCDLHIGDDGKGFVILPRDFMRLLCFRMSDWTRPVYEAITESDALYGRQSSKWKGVCGSASRPVCAVVRRSEGLVLEFYSSRSGRATVAQATYLPYPIVDRDGGIDVAEGCYRAAVYRAASLALASVGDQNWQTMLEISKSLMT
ncbi:hypothetical protein [uncultured Duncaniella sp.]|uniref:hypothetical protein n=1 Tax=uncultured Duncaniella sp. TaxID=2768039 RepID=UPI00273029DC|nr:hypothetical protein [uncultured Duncaniella sp.]